MNGGAEFDEVFLDEVRVPADVLLGPENEGWNVGMSALTNERGYIGASTISLQRRLDAMAALGGGLDAVERERAGRAARRAAHVVSRWAASGPGGVGARRRSMKLGITEMLFDDAMLRARDRRRRRDARRTTRRTACSPRPRAASPAAPRRCSATSSANASSASRRSRGPDARLGVSPR